MLSSFFFYLQHQYWFNIYIKLFFSKRVNSIFPLRDKLQYSYKYIKGKKYDYDRLLL